MDLPCTSETQHVTPVKRPGRHLNISMNVEQEPRLGPTQGGGKTNDGNSARRFFKHTETTSRITGINEDVLKGFLLYYALFRVISY